MGLWRRQTGLFHWATSSSSPKHEARLGLAAGSRDECSPTVCSDKRMIKIKAGHAAQNTQLWWQKEDNGQREGRWSEQTAIQPQSLFSFLGYETVHLPTPRRRVSSVYCPQMCCLQYYYKALKEPPFVTYK